MAAADALDDDTMRRDAPDPTVIDPMQPTAQNGTTTAANTWTYRCASCGYTASASLDGLDAADATGTEAATRERILDAAATSVRLAACPRCGQRSDDEMRRLLRTRVYPALTYGVLGGFLGTLATCIARATSDSLDVVSGAVLAGVFAAATFVLPTWRRLAATRRVRFATPVENQTP